MNLERFLSFFCWRKVSSNYRNHIFFSPIAFLHSQHNIYFTIIFFQRLLYKATITLCNSTTINLFTTTLSLSLSLSLSDFISPCIFFFFFLWFSLSSSGNSYTHSYGSLGELRTTSKTKAYEALVTVCSSGTQLRSNVCTLKLYQSQSRWTTTMFFTVCLHFTIGGQPCTGRLSCTGLGQNQGLQCLTQTWLRKLLWTQMGPLERSRWIPWLSCYLGKDLFSLLVRNGLFIEGSQTGPSTWSVLRWTCSLSWLFFRCMYIDRIIWLNG